MRSRRARTGPRARCGCRIAAARISKTPVPSTYISIRARRASCVAIRRCFSTPRGWIGHEPNDNADESELITDNLQGSNTLHNIFYVRKPRGNGKFDRYGQTSVEPGASQTLTSYEE